METLSLLKKYNVAAPRYTSYPTVPYWDIAKFTTEKWLNALKTNYANNSSEGISVYIHLPFCESLCTYCGCNTRITKNHGVEVPYIEAVIKEWEMYCEVLGETPKIRELHLGGGTPTFFSAKNLKTLLDAILGKQHTIDQIECSFEGHPDNTTVDHLQTLYQFGFKRVSLGIQDFDPHVQLMINRFQTVEQVATITNKAREIGYDSVNFDLIYGLPFQNLNGLANTIKEVINLKPDRIAFYSYAHVPWLKPGQRRYTERDIPKENEKFALYQLGREILLDAGYKEIGMDHFALGSDALFKASENRKLHRNFMGYTHQYTSMLLGLGVSSISDSGNAFAQNLKTVEAYLKTINKGDFALEKGHLLTDLDLYIRKHILNLMCQNETKFSNQIPLIISERLAPMVADKIVKLDDYSVTVSEIGKSFLRNICMAFDERLWQKQPATKVFSTAI
ncbi:oxygen-independent coproporphyrinogen III oxidase [Pedobacter namyangjuensis]|uniref:oxygen-independent coproporphyrinogen III oxidase n=1 Tax=Pedobacter namyangjuensis TaxID=600626 RepID=UPI000DE3A49E|nr:oxygen-independent coproporphyrinogen III oxidase [Pedobacter namyangjuensis]